MTIGLLDKITSATKSLMNILENGCSFELTGKPEFSFRKHHKAVFYNLGLAGL
jgi:hypothetical protein